MAWFAQVDPADRRRLVIEFTLMISMGMIGWFFGPSVFSPDFDDVGTFTRLRLAASGPAALVVGLDCRASTTEARSSLEVDVGLELSPSQSATWEIAFDSARAGATPSISIEEYSWPGTTVQPPEVSATPGGGSVIRGEVRAGGAGSHGFGSLSGSDFYARLFSADGKTRDSVSFHVSWAGPNPCQAASSHLSLRIPDVVPDQDRPPSRFAAAAYATIPPWHARVGYSTALEGNKLLTWRSPTQDFTGDSLATTHYGLKDLVWAGAKPPRYPNLGAFVYGIAISLLASFIYDLLRFRPGSAHSPMTLLRVPRRTGAAIDEAGSPARRRTGRAPSLRRDPGDDVGCPLSRKGCRASRSTPRFAICGTVSFR